MKYDPLKHQRRSVRLAGYDYAAPGAYFVTICTQQRQMFFDQPELRQLAEACWRAIPAHAPRVGLDEWVVMPNHIHGLIVIVGEGEANEAGDNMDDQGRGVQPQRGATQLNAPTANAKNVPPTNTMNVSADNTLNAVDGRGRGVQLNAPTANAMNVPATKAMNTRSALARPRDDGNPFSAMSPRLNTLSVIVRTYKAAVTSACRAAQRSEFAWQRGFYEHVVRNDRELAAIRQYIRENPLKWALDRDNPANTRRLAPPVSVADYLEDLALTQTS